ncbi:MAG: cobB, partial [Firmicutes bacterium]|nr:cobB [Bacillota bacterium]
GGLMYLTDAIVDGEGSRFPMVGRLNCEARMQGTGLRLGYVTATARRDHLLARAGEQVRGHEFHCSELTGTPDDPAWSCQGSFDAPRHEGFAAGRTLASYVHLNFAASPCAAKRLADAASGMQP